jgi:hypothetical protein
LLIQILDGKEKLLKEAGERREERQRLRVESLPVLTIIERFWVLSPKPSSAEISARESAS